MSTAVRHPRVSDDVSANRVNRVNPAPSTAARPRDERGGTGKSAGQVWSNIEALKALLARADRELAREPGGYVAVAVVGGDKREEQVGRWGWAGSRDAGGRVAILGNGLVAGARGLRVRVHREGGGLVGSALLRKTAAVARERERAPPPVSNAPTTTVDPDRLAAVEALLGRVLARSAAQDREITVLKATITEMGPVQECLGNLHARLDDLEAVAHRHEEAYEEEEAEDDDEGGEDEDEPAYEADK